MAQFAKHMEAEVYLTGGGLRWGSPGK
jgi:hypothetical protein